MNRHLRNSLLLVTPILLASCSSIEPRTTQSEAFAYTCPIPADLHTPGGNIINTNHIFCGEVTKSGNKLTAKGFHAKDSGRFPSTISTTPATIFTPSPSPAANKYTIENFYIFDPATHSYYTKTKSTMFPDSCTSDQIIASIDYAKTHPLACTSTWLCGVSGPATSSPQYCYTRSSSTAPLQPFTILMDITAGNLINTAYPQ
ncbi:EndoU domain-containing protein [Pseudomonas chlororaphis]|uniref:EndoU domain-containing protein n=1 Tax=Pseudomonas chlororaphis TaxID=587753 RepID=UPI00155DC468